MSIRVLGIVLLLSLAATSSPPAAQEAQEAKPPPAAPAPADSDRLARVSPEVILETQKPPKYPPAALAARYTGSVVVQAVVLPDGKVGEVVVLECTRPKVGFERAAMDAVKKWRFVPGRIGERPAEVTLRFRLNFAPGGVSLASDTIPGGSTPSSTDSASNTNTK